VRTSLVDGSDLERANHYVELQDELDRLEAVRSSTAASLLIFAFAMLNGLLGLVTGAIGIILFSVLMFLPAVWLLRRDRSHRQQIRLIARELEGDHRVLHDRGEEARSSLEAPLGDA
jgi:hypothetical protein